MRVSCLMLVTLREVPADAEIISHKLLLRGGFFRKVTSGIYAYMPLMWRVLSKISSIIQEEMNATGALQTLLPQLHPAEQWEKSGRWQGYTAGEGIMFHLKDRQGKELGLAPTHEEIITTIAGEAISSYKQLPVNLYQIQTKFRDEIRPRFGLMRSREFIMKDGYSFHADENCLKSTYEKINKAYERIFTRCGIKAIAVDADSGAIGEGASQEFMAKAKAGEDLILISSDGVYAANQEKAISLPTPAKILEASTPSEIDTPNQFSIEEVCSGNNIDASQVIKVLLMLAILRDGKEQPILISIRGDQEINEIKLANTIESHLSQAIIDLTPINEDHLRSQGLNNFPFGSIAPDLNDSILSEAKSWNRSFIRFVDKTAAELNSFFCGSNKVNKHRSFMHWDLIGGLPKIVDIRKAKAGDSCIHDSSQTLEEARGIEVGHIFQLGRKYSESLQSSFTNESGSQENFWMGCYGIGVSRLAQAAVEQSNDDSGIIWPLTIAPFEVNIIIANTKDKEQLLLGEKLYKEFKDAEIDVLIDDRDERAGVKFKDSDLIGIPWKIIAGRESASGKVEVAERSTSKKELLPAALAIKKTIQAIKAEKKLLGPPPL